ncbi:MAG TPA: hypothetical protein VHD33_06085, partial [Legionellaceae bacterium]|nr:hypothetical protein [Legionellaceae bacterium]
MKSMLRGLVGTFLVVGLMNGTMAAMTSAEVLEAEYKDPAKYPLGCRDVGYEYTLNTVRLVHESNPQITDQEQGGQTLFFVYNRLSTPINLNQMLQDNSTRNTYLNHTIQPKQWAVLATNQEEINYICSINAGKTGYGKVVNCGDSLKICEYVRVKFGL